MIFTEVISSKPPDTFTYLFTYNFKILRQWLYMYFECGVLLSIIKSQGVPCHLRTLPNNKKQHLWVGFNFSYITKLISASNEKWKSTETDD